MPNKHTETDSEMEGIFCPVCCSLDELQVQINQAERSKKPRRASFLKGVLHARTIIMCATASRERN